MLEIIFIVGPTATGKTDVAFQLARSLGAQIISADSMAIYTEPRIITSKPNDTMCRHIPHHLVNIISVGQNYSVFDYYQEANKIIETLIAQNIPLIVCGGSGLYIKAILDGIFEGVGQDIDLRKRLEVKAAEGGKELLLEELKSVDPQTAAKVKDVRRIIRALEVYYLTGVPLSKKKQEAQGLWGSVPTKIFGLRLARETLYEKINKRVDVMFESGATQEVEGLLKFNLSTTASKMIGIKEITGYLRGEYDVTAAKELMKKNTRNFAKKQLTWFRADRRIKWIDIESLDEKRVAGEILRAME